MVSLGWCIRRGTSGEGDGAADYLPPSSALDTQHRLTTIAAILFYWITMKVVQQLTGLTLGRPNSLTCLTAELLNTPAIVKYCGPSIKLMKR